MTVAWIRDRALTLAMMAMFLLFLAGQFVTGFYEYNATQAEHGQARVTVAGYLETAIHGRRFSRTGRVSSSRWPCSFW